MICWRRWSHPERSWFPRDPGNSSGPHSRASGPATRRTKGSCRRTTNADSAFAMIGRNISCGSCIPGLRYLSTERRFRDRAGSTAALGATCGHDPQWASRIHRPHSRIIVLSDRWGCLHCQRRSLLFASAVRHDMQSTRPGAGSRKRLRLLLAQRRVRPAAPLPWGTPPRLYSPAAERGILPAFAQ